ncbi:uncharacterized protein [Vicugna pacos]|uniref:GDP-fucose protein O-fucosyltransferase 2 n=1 Tax=Vicugna pacos TaxID=30538 RepID=A0ABM5BHV1_VICPA
MATGARSSRFWPGQSATDILSVAASHTRYLLCDFNPPEGFSLRRDVCIHIAFLLKTLLKVEELVLVLPPWGHLYHWQSPDINQVRIPWSNFFDLQVSTETSLTFSTSSSLQGSLGDNNSNQSNSKPLQNSVLLIQELCVHNNPMSWHHYEFHFTGTVSGPSSPGCPPPLPPLVGAGRGTECTSCPGRGHSTDSVTSSRCGRDLQAWGESQAVCIQTGGTWSVKKPSPHCP